MNILKKTLIMVGCVAGLGLGASTMMAQGGGAGGGYGGGGGAGGGGGFGRRGNPQARLDQLRGDMEVKDDAEWNAISAQITVVDEARRASVRMGGRGRGRGGNGGATPGGGQPTDDAVAALRAAVANHAPAPEIKDKLAKVREEVKTKQAAVTKAQDDLRSLVNARQEAVLVLNGVLN